MNFSSSSPHRVAAQEWLDSPLYDSATRAAVRALLDDPDESVLIDAFYRTLEFGTGGLRGVMGVGTNRMNTYVVAVATEGLARYLRSAFANLPEIAVVVGYDNRHHSAEFARTTASVLTAHGIRVHLFSSLRPTPEVSFAIRHLGAQAGVNITASHNPKEYNGYKVYWDDGAQVVAPHDRGIMEQVSRLTLADVCREERPMLINWIDEEMDRCYIERIRSLSSRWITADARADLRIVYTPLHGTGGTLIPQTLRACGFMKVSPVIEQTTPDGSFSTVRSPNPDNKQTLAIALEQAQREDADLVLASDPDADRLSAAYKDSGEWRMLSGHEMLLVLTYHSLITARDKYGSLNDAYIVKTLVATDLLKTMAADFGVTLRETYIGFKWIARALRGEEGQRRFLGGGEESYGFLGADFVRDKDAVSTAMLIAEICADLKTRETTFRHLLAELYERYGYCATDLFSLHRPGKEGAEEIERLLAHFRQCPPSHLAGAPVMLVRDFSILTAYDAERRPSPIHMPAPSNMIQWFTDKGTKVTVRPSGTEPKLRFYIETNYRLHSTITLRQAEERAAQTIALVRRDLEELTTQ